MQKIDNKPINFLYKIVSFLPFLVLLSIIFSFSTQNGSTSSSLSGIVSKKIVIILNNAFSFNWTSFEEIQYAESIEFLVRKAAHITEFFLLTLFFIFPLSQFIKYRNLIWKISIATIVVFAALDEIHQTFIPGRTGQIKDVFIDSIGILLAILFYQLYGFIGRKHQ